MIFRNSFSSYLPLGFFLFMAVLYNSCNTSSSVRMINDQIKNNKTFTWKGTFYSTSAKFRNSRHFELFLMKETKQSDILTLTVKSSFTVLEKDYIDTIYFIFPNGFESFPLRKIDKNIEYKEQLNTVTTRNMINTKVDTEESIKTTPIFGEEVTPRALTEEKDIKTTTTTTTNTDVKVDSKILNKVLSERIVLIPAETFENFKNNDLITLRIYSVDGDFWNIKIPPYITNKWIKLSKGIFDVYSN
jgi:hypothetical protein